MNSIDDNLIGISANTVLLGTVVMLRLMRPNSNSAALQSFEHPCRLSTVAIDNVKKCLCAE